MATKTELSDILFFTVPKEVADRMIAIYLESRSFDDANEWAKQMFVHSGDFNSEHIRRILAGAASNSQVLGSYQIGPLISNLRSRKMLPEDEFAQLLNSNGLEKYALTAGGQD